MFIFDNTMKNFANVKINHIFFEFDLFSLQEIVYLKKTLSLRGEWDMTGMLSLMLYIFGVSADVGSSP